MKNIFLFLALSLTLSVSAQTTAMDFNRNDCNGIPRHLFAELDANRVVILEYFMNACTPCINAGNHLEALKADLLVDYPGAISSYSFGYNNTYSCTTISNWVTTNGFSSIPMDSGATQVAYYGGFGMPTVVVVAGTDHRILNTFVGWGASDTNAIADSVRAFFATATYTPAPSALQGFDVYPNPAHQAVYLSGNADAADKLDVQLFSLSGACVMRSSDNKVVAGPWNLSMDVATLPSGLYLLKVNSTSGSVARKVAILH